MYLLSCCEQETSWNFHAEITWCLILNSKPSENQRSTHTQPRVALQGHDNEDRCHSRTNSTTTTTTINTPHAQSDRKRNLTNNPPFWISSPVSLGPLMSLHAMKLPWDKTNANDATKGQDGWSTTELSNDCGDVFPLLSSFLSLSLSVSPPPPPFPHLSTLPTTMREPSFYDILSPDAAVLSLPPPVQHAQYVLSVCAHSNNTTQPLMLLVLVLSIPNHFKLMCNGAEGPPTPPSLLTP